MQRQSPRVILRNPRRGRFGEDEVLVLEMGLGGAKFEHAGRFDVGRIDTFTCGQLTPPGLSATPCSCPRRPASSTRRGIAFTDLGERERNLLLELLVHEAEQQVTEWEANLRGEAPPPRHGKPRRQSAVATRYLCLRYTHQGWLRAITSDPNQPVDGITIPETTPEDEVAILRRSYERAEGDTREFMRQVAMLAILEQMRTA